jgi:hypothetical protein
MKFLLVLILLISTAYGDSFETDSILLAQKLKAGLMKQLSEQIAKNGASQAVGFCHENVVDLAKQAAGDLSSRYEFGRTSHKWRNDKNEPKEWVRPYLEKYQGKLKSEITQEFIIHKLPQGKRVYLEPLYVAPLCLQCHGESLKSDVKEKISRYYPHDKAIGFKLNEFRGFIWVKEK